ncbi:MAG: chemotaxis protein CheD [Acidobacteria bacterium]|jgi:chemotaxis protein CheD|nr:chemotaxis protein CheD [Acidobacteriota bacterium]
MATPSVATAAAPTRPSGLTMGTSVDSPPARRIVIGIGEHAVSADTGSVIVTHALGSCIAVCVYDQVAHVGGLLHFLLPDSRINPARAQQQPSTFADLGIPQLFQDLYRIGAVKSRCVVKLVGGADVSSLQKAGTLDIGRRNQVAAKNILWKNGVLIKAERLGGSEPRNVALNVLDGTVRISSSNHIVVEL